MAFDTSPRTVFLIIVRASFQTETIPIESAVRDISFRVTLDPKVADRPTAMTLSPFGVALNGIPFDPGAAEFWQRNPRSGWQYEAMGGAVNLGLDDSNAHVQPTGAYHYHGVPVRLMRKLMQAETMIMVGYAADGFPIYAMLGHDEVDDSSSELRKMKSGYRIKQGQRPGGPGGRHDGSFVQDYEFVEGEGDLDECNGRFGVTPEYPSGIYHYYLTDSFPYIPRMFKGAPDESFMRGGPGGGRNGGGFGPPGRRGPGGFPPPFGPGGRRPPPRPR